MGIKNPKFYADFNMGQTIFVISSYQKLEPKYGFQKKITSLKIELFGLTFDRS
jgi:hypothetical protein